MFLVCVDIEVDLALDVVVDVDEVGFYGMGSFVHDVPSQPPLPLLSSRVVGNGTLSREDTIHHLLVLGFPFFGIAFFVIQYFPFES